MKTLLLPVAGKSARYPGMRPKWLLTMPNGKLMIEQSISKLNCDKFDKIYVIALKEHLDKYVIKKKLLASLKKNISKKIEIFSLDKNTTCQAETILKFLEQKKIRSSLILSMGKLYDINPNKLLNICGAVECIHSYSLIHDDLPCMDDDKLRRGKITTHIKFGEATAVLAGNSLLTLAFEMISDRKFNTKKVHKLEISKKLAECSGHTGIAGGQALDLEFENKKKQLLSE